MCGDPLTTNNFFHWTQELVHLDQRNTWEHEYEADTSFESKSDQSQQPEWDETEVVAHNQCKILWENKIANPDRKLGAKFYVIVCHERLGTLITENKQFIQTYRSNYCQFRNYLRSIFCHCVSSDMIVIDM